MRTKSDKVIKLVIICKDGDRWRRLTPAVGGNHRLRAHHALVSGKPVHFPGSYYAIRTYKDRKTVYRTVGADPDEAAKALKRERQLMEARDAAGAARLTLIEPTSERLELKKRRLAYLEQLAAEGKERAVETMTIAIDDFLAATRHKYSDEITQDSMSTLYTTLRVRGNADRTVFNKAVSLGGWFKYMGLDRKAIIPRRPTFTTREVVIYEPEEYKALFAACRSRYFKVVLQTLLMTGMRMQEAMNLRWVNVDFLRNEIRVRERRGQEKKVPSQPGPPNRKKVTIKDKGERSITIHKELREVLLAWRKERPDALLVLGTRDDKPNKKWLQTLKRLASNSGLNCGDCDGCTGSGDCDKWTLKRFRATFTTNLLRTMDARTVMQQTGHQDLATVMLYWRPLSNAQAAAKMDEVRWA